MSGEQRHIKGSRREYMATLRKSHSRIDCLIPPEEADVLKEAAKLHSMKLSQYVKLSSLAYTRQNYLVPDPDVLQELIFQIRKIGVNINQLAKRANEQRYVTTDDWDEALSRLRDMEARVEQALSQPVKAR